MTRKEGFIDVGSILQEIGVDTTDLDSILKSSSIRKIKHDPSGTNFSFDYKGETYFYKCNSCLYDGMLNPYNELVAEELAKDFGLSYVDHDLAIIGSNKGVLSKNFMDPNVNYISGKDILFNLWKSTIRDINSVNNLESIWDALEYRYHNKNNKREIIRDLMTKILNIYLFDIISCQTDRHCKNWQITEFENKIDVSPVFDNDRILFTYNGPTYASIMTETDNDIFYESLWDSIRKFQSVSSEEFTNLLKEKIWIVGEENLNKVFERIEKKTGYPMPEERKNFYLSNYQEHKRKLEEVLGLTVEREEHNERKNR